jgi:hypothetical protein
MLPSSSQTSAGKVLDGVLNTGVYQETAAASLVLWVMNHSTQVSLTGSLGMLDFMGKGMD